MLSENALNAQLILPAEEWRWSMLLCRFWPWLGLLPLLLEEPRKQPILRYITYPAFLPRFSLSPSGGRIVEDAPVLRQPLRKEPASRNGIRMDDERARKRGGK